MSNCTKCGGHADAYLCTRCSDELRTNLTQICWLADELGNAAAKLTAMTVYTTRQRNPDSEEEEQSPVPYNPHAHSCYDQLRTVCMRWVRDFCDQLGCEFMPVDAVPADFIGPLPKFGQHHPGIGYIPDPRDRWRMRPGYIPTTRDLAKWLRHHWLAIVNSDDAALCAIELDTAVQAARREINPRRRVFCGPCPTVTGEDDHGRPIHCAVAIWAEWDLKGDAVETHATCRRCRTQHESQALLDAGFDHAHDYLMTRAEIIGILNDSGDTELKVDTFKKWRKRRQIEPQGWKHRDRITDVRIYASDPAVYRFGDARALYKRMEARREAASV